MPHTLRLPTGAEIVLAGESTVISTADNVAVQAHTVYVDGAMTIGGDGKLTSIGGHSTVGNVSAIYANAKLTITGGNITAIGGNSNTGESRGVYASSIEVSGGTVYAYGKQGAQSYGVYIAGSLTVSDDGEAYANGETAAALASGTVNADTWYGSAYGTKGGIAASTPKITVESNGTTAVKDAKLTAVAAPATPVITIDNPPTANTTVTEGEISGSLTVAASVTQSATLSYQWYKNSTNSNSGGTAESGATSASFTIPTGLAKGTYYYYCVVSATGGAADVASSVAAVKVTGPLYKITFNRGAGFGGTAEITAYEGTQMPQITPPVLPGSSKSFNGYYSEEEGEGTKYYDKDGKSVNTGNSDHDELHAYFK